MAPAADWVRKVTRQPNSSIEYWTSIHGQFCEEISSSTEFRHLEFSFVKNSAPVEKNGSYEFCEDISSSAEFWTNCYGQFCEEISASTEFWTVMDSFVKKSAPIQNFGQLWIVL